MDLVELTINGHKVKVPPKTTIMEAALSNGIYIPHLCYDPRLKPFGACRLCLVEWEGSPKLFAACSTPVRQDMVINTETEKTARARKVVLELLLVHHPLECPVCDKAGECELQDMSFKYGSKDSRFDAERKHSPEILSAPLIERNPNRCILCGLCVRICTEHQGVGAISFINRGAETIISPAFEETLDCEFCGQCIDACPVGALGSKPFRHRSRVWFIRDQASICPYCGCGCTVTLGTSEGRIVRSYGKVGTGMNNGDLCGKGRFGFDFLYSDKRLKTPLIKRGGKLEPATWEEAMQLVASRLTEIRDAHGANAIGAIGSQRTSIEDSYAMQRFMRKVVGTANIDSAAAFGYARAQRAIRKSFGLKTHPIAFDGPLSADMILTVESDVTSTLPVYGLRLLWARRDKGAGLVVMDPRQTKLSRHATDWLRNKPATAIAVLNAMMKTMLDEGIHSKDAEKTANFQALRDSLESCTPEWAEPISGVPADRIRKAARDMAKAKKPLVCVTLGETENNKSESTVLAAANLVMLIGAGPEALQVPATLANTLGMFEVGIRPDAGPGHAKLDRPGLGIDAMIYAEDSPIKAMYIMGENPMVSFPRLDLVQKRLSGLEFLVVQDIILTDTAKMADVVIPACAWSEKEGTYLGAAGVLQKTIECSVRTGEGVPDWQVFRNLSRYMMSETGHGDIDELRAEMAASVNFEFTTEGATPSFNPVAFTAPPASDESYPLSMVVGALMQHSGSLSALSSSLGSVVSDAYLQINNIDARRHGIRDEHYVRVSSKRGEVLMKARVTDEVPEGMLFAPAHFSHARVNNLTEPGFNGNAAIVPVKVELA